MLRKVALSLLILISVFTLMPFAESAAHGIRQTIATHRHHRRHHSRRWWRRHRRLKRLAALAHRQRTLAALPLSPNKSGATAAVTSQLPNGWNAMPASANGDLRFRSVMPGETAQAALSVVALSQAPPAYLPPRAQRQMLGGVSYADLRRIVIDKMIASGGWVTNDFEREVEGHHVFIVTAQIPSDGRSPDKAWISYFTEINGRIYSLTTEANLQSAERMASEAEKFIASLR